jgi:hypothetical protein
MLNPGGGNNIATPGARKTIEETVLTWPGVVAQPHRFGGTEYRLGGREVGHIHGDHLLDIAFPKPVRDEIVAAGQAQPHHILPDTGWVSLYIRTEEDVDRAVALLHRSFELAREQQERKYGAGKKKEAGGQHGPYLSHHSVVKEHSPRGDSADPTGNDPTGKDSTEEPVR